MTHQRTRRRHILGWTAVAVAFLVSLFFLDAPIANTLRQPMESNQTMNILTSFKCWGDGVAIVTISLAIMLVVPNRRRTTFLMLIAVLVAAGIADGFKFISDRKRPFELDELAARGPIWETDGGSNSAFPSGHVASAFAFARGIGTLFPQTMPLCIVAATGTGVSRMVKERHFLSDCIGGAVLGWLTVGLVFRLEALCLVRFRRSSPMGDRCQPLGGQNPEQPVLAA